MTTFWSGSPRTKRSIFRATSRERRSMVPSVRGEQALIGRSAPPDQLADPVRAAIAERLRQLGDLNWLRNAWKGAVDAEERLPDLRSARATAEQNKLLAEACLAALEDGEPEASSGDLARQARDLDALVRLGRNLGLHDGHCPLCASNVTHSEFENGLAIAAAHARQLDEKPSRWPRMSGPVRRRRTPSLKRRRNLTAGKTY